MENNERSRIRKVALSSFIDLLLSLYKKGVDYVDIVHLVDDDDRDMVGIHFTEEYMQKKKGKREIKLPTKLTENDIDDLTSM